MAERRFVTRRSGGWHSPFRAACDDRLQRFHGRSFPRIGASGTIPGIVDAEDIKREVERKAQGGRISCREARALAEELGVDYREVGRACDELGVKIHACELGCF